MTLEGEIVGATNIIKSNSHPNWNCRYWVDLPAHIDTDTRAYLKFSVFHDNPFGNEIPIGECSVFLRDKKLQVGL
jgi:hypothetical protein